MKKKKKLATIFFNLKRELALNVDSRHRQHLREGRKEEKMNHLWIGLFKQIRQIKFAANFFKRDKR